MIMLTKQYPRGRRCSNCTWHFNNFQELVWIFSRVSQKSSFSLGGLFQNGHVSCFDVQTNHVVFGNREFHGGDFNFGVNKDGNLQSSVSCLADQHFDLMFVVRFSLEPPLNFWIGIHGVKKHFVRKLASFLDLGFREKTISRDFWSYFRQSNSEPSVWRNFFNAK